MPEDGSRVILDTKELVDQGIDIDTERRAPAYHLGKTKEDHVLLYFKKSSDPWSWVPEIVIAAPGGMKLPADSSRFFSFDTYRDTTPHTYTNGFATISGLELLDTSAVTDMSEMFYGYQAGYMYAGAADQITLDLSNWDVSHVTNMQGMFKKCCLSDLNMSG